jgi:tRNA synthetases class II (A)
MQAQGAVSGKAAAKTLFAQLMNALHDAKTPTTDDSCKFNGQEDIDAKVLMLFDPKGNSALEVAANCTDLWVLLDRTNFYACMGGQVGDRGHLILPSGKKLNVLDTQVSVAVVAVVCVWVCTLGFGALSLLNGWLDCIPLNFFGDCLSDRLSNVLSNVLVLFLFVFLFVFCSCCSPRSSPGYWWICGSYLQVGR